MPPQLTAPKPPSASAEPASPPISACPELDGRPRYQVNTFQPTAAARPEPITAAA